MLKTIGVECAVLNALEAAGMEPIVSLFLKGGGNAEDGGEITFGGNNAVRFNEVKFGDTEICKKDGDTYCKASIDSGCSLLVGPKEKIDAFNKETLS